MKPKDLLTSLLSALKREGASSVDDLETEPRELVLFRRSVEAEERGDFESAVALLREAIELSPECAPLHNRLGVLLAIRLKRHAEAVIALKRAVDLEPDSLVYRHNLSQVARRVEETTEH